MKGKTTNLTSGITSDKIAQLKKSLQSLNPEDDIAEILDKIPNVKKYDRASPPKNNENIKISPDSSPRITHTTNINYGGANSKRDTNIANLAHELEYIRTNAIENFCDGIISKTDSEIQRLLPKKFEEYQKKIQLIVDKSDQQYNSYVQQLTSSKDKNSDLKIQISQMKTEEKKLFQQYEESNRSIRKLKLKFDLFSKLKPLFESLVTEFERSPIEETLPHKIVEDIKLRRAEEESCREEVEKKKQELDSLKEEQKEIKLKSQNRVEELSKQITDKEKESKSKLYEYQNELMNLQYEVSNFTNYKKENLKLHNMLIQIFNLLFPKLNLERDLIKNENGLELDTNDYKPRPYDEDEILRYIYLMIRNSTEASAGILLRESIAYSNMMLREIAKDKINQNYNPAFVFKEMMKLITETERENDNLNNVIEKFQEDDKKDKELIKQLENEIQKEDNEYNVLLNKVNKMFKERIETKKKEKSEYIKSKTTNKFLRTNTAGQEKGKLKKLKDGTPSLLSMTTSNMASSTPGASNANLFKRTSQQMKHNILLNPKDINLPMFNDYKEQNSKRNSLGDFMGQEIFRPKVNKKFYHFNSEPATDMVEGMKNLVDHTNRLFLYKSRGRTPTGRAVDRLNKKISHLNQIHHQNFLSTQQRDEAAGVLGKLDSLITGIKNEDKEKN